MAGTESWEVDVSFVFGEAKRVAGTVRKLWKNGNLGVEAKMLQEGVVVCMSQYVAEMWGLRETERRKFDVFEMRCLRSICGLTFSNRERNEEVRRRAQEVGQLSGRVDQCVLRWLGNVREWMRNLWPSR